MNKRSEFGPRIVPFTVTKYQSTKAFKSVVRVYQGQAKRRDVLRVSIYIRDSVVIRQKFHIGVAS